MADRPLEIEAAEKLLRNGLWHAGPTVVRAMGEVIPPGKAERRMLAELKDPAQYSRDRLIEMGRRRMSHETVYRQIRAGRWESDPARLTKTNWLGFETWKIRDRFPGAISVAEMADRIVQMRPDLNFTAPKLVKWIAAGVVPRPLKPSGTHWMIPQELIPVYERVAKAAPAKAARWEVAPQSLWKPPVPTAKCPHCGAELELEVTVRAALKLEGGDESASDDDDEDEGDLAQQELAQEELAQEELDAELGDADDAAMDGSETQSVIADAVKVS